MKSIFENVDGYDEIKRARERLPRSSQASDHVHATRTIDRTHPNRVRLVVDGIRQETTSAKTIRLVSPTGYLPPFQAGQYISLYVDINGIRTCRPYSITSTPLSRGFYELTTKRMPDPFVSAYLNDDLKVGDSLESSSPDGQFFYNPLIHGQDLVMLAGGSGITPVISIIRDLVERRPDVRISLLYGSSTPDDIIFFDALAVMEERNANLKVTHVISSPPAGYAGKTGLISAELIGENTPDARSSTYFVCGPEAMYRFCLAELDRMGIPRKRIRTELFGPPDDITSCAGWPDHLSAGECVEVCLDGGQPFPAKVGEPLLIAFERNRQSVPAACRTGQCSMCRVRIKAGDIFESPGSGLRRSDRWFGYVHACMAYPISDVEVCS